MVVGVTGRVVVNGDLGVGVPQPRKVPEVRVRGWVGVKVALQHPWLVDRPEPGGGQPAFQQLLHGVVQLVVGLVVGGWAPPPPPAPLLLQQSQLLLFF